jgi:hypothetical protein
MKTNNIMAKPLSRDDKRAFIKSILRGDHKTAIQLIDDRIPRGDCVPLFWQRDTDGNFIAGGYDTDGKYIINYTLTPAEYAELSARTPCFL